MATLDKIKVGGVDYDIVDSQARADIETLKKGEVDAYTKGETDNLLKGKQDKMSGNYLSKVDVGGSSISIETKAFADESVQKTDTVNFKTINGNAIFGMGNIDIDVDTSNLAPKSDLGGLKLVKITQSAYDSLGTKDNNTLYIITD